MPEQLSSKDLKALSAETRQEIVRMLSKRPYTASELSKIMKKHVTTIKEHLEILEDASMVRRKDGTNKWVYYDLADKGQKLFKPNFYSWIITLSVSCLVMITGAFQIVQGSANVGAKMIAESATQDGSLLLAKTVVNTSVVNNDVLFGVVLMILGLIGIGYLVIKKYLR